MFVICEDNASLKVFKQITLNFFDYLNDQYIVQIMNSKTRYCSNNERYTLKTLVLATSRLIIY